MAIGNNHVRETLAETLKVDWYTAIHPSAQIGIDVVIGEGTAVMANAVINPGARIWKHCIVNTASVIEHDNRIEDYVHVSVGAKLGGTVKLGKSSWIGIGAMVKNNLSICSGCLVGAGGVVVKDLFEPGTYVGVPVQKLRNNEYVM